MSSRPRIEVVYGTRPEAIKTAPVIRLLRENQALDTTVVVTGQHGAVLHQIQAHFGIVPDVDMAVLRTGQGLGELSAVMFAALTDRWRNDAPHAVLVQGDTATVALAALAAYYAGVRVVHLEAGLRSGDLRSPFPEEGNRRIVGQLAGLHLAPTPAARSRLLAEGVDAATVVVTGNTVIDALRWSANRPAPFDDPRLEEMVAGPDRIVLVTAHRRESWDGGLRRIAEGIAAAVAGRPEVRVVIPLHPNPLVRAAIEPVLRDQETVLLCDPLPYAQFARLLSRSWCAVTDSGGVQEEAPSLGVPVLVTRACTERTETITAGAARLVGTDTNLIATELTALLDQPGVHDRMSHTISPYGDGHAARRAVAAIEHLLGVGDRIPDFGPVLNP